MVEAYRRSRDRPKPVKVKVDGIEDNRCQIGPDQDDDRGWLIRLTDALGTSTDGDDQRHAGDVAGVQPRNEVEGMLAVQLAATHVQALALLERAKRAQHIPQFEADGNMAVKLLLMLGHKPKPSPSYGGAAVRQ
jgi:hypothetical protein